MQPWKPTDWREIRRMVRNLTGRVRAEETRQSQAERLHAEVAARVYAETGAAYLALFERVMTQLDLTEEQRARVPELLQAELRALTEDRS